MNKKQEAQIAMQKAVKMTMEKYHGIWQPVAELSRNYDLFVNNMNKIDVYLKTLAEDIDPLMQELAASRTKLIEQLFPATSVLGVYAFDRGDRKLLDLTSVKFTGLEKMKPGQLKNFTRRILKSSQTLMAKEPGAGKKTAAGHIKDYGLGEKHLEDMQHTLDRFIAMEEKLESILWDKRKSKKKLAGSIRNNRLILKKKMDRMMQLFRETDAEFFQQYIKSRVKAKVVSADEKAAVKQKPARKSSGIAKRETGTRVRAGKMVKVVKVADRNPVEGTLDPLDGQSAQVKK